MIFSNIKQMIICIFYDLAYGQDPTVTIVQTEPATWYGTKKMTTVRDTDVTLSCYVENLPYTATVSVNYNHHDS